MTQQTLTKPKLKPLGSRVLAKRLEQEESSVGGIILPDSAKQKQEIAEVIAVGPGKKNEDGNLIEMPVKVGDKFLMDRYAGQEVTVESEEYIIVKAEDIIAIVE